MEYQNKTYKETEKDISGKNLELLSMITEKQRKFRGMRYAEEMAYFAMLWLKYYRKENTTYDRLVRTVMCEEYWIVNTFLDKFYKECCKRYATGV